MCNMLRSFARYLGENYEAGTIDFSMRVMSDGMGNLRFYIHPERKDGHTMDFTIGTDASPPTPIADTGSRVKRFQEGHEPVTLNQYCRNHDETYNGGEGCPGCVASDDQKGTK